MTRIPGLCECMVLPYKAICAQKRKLLMIQSLRDFSCIQQCAHWQKRRSTKGFSRSLTRMATYIHCAVFFWPPSIVSASEMLLLRFTTNIVITNCSHANKVFHIARLDVHLSTGQILQTNVITKLAWLLKCVVCQARDEFKFCKSRKHSRRKSRKPRVVKRKNCVRIDSATTIAIKPSISLTRFGGPWPGKLTSWIYSVCFDKVYPLPSCR